MISGWYLGALQISDPGRRKPGTPGSVIGIIVSDGPVRRPKQLEDGWWINER